MPKVSIVTLGCPKNAIDSEGLGGLLAAGGHELTGDVADADVVLVNTCGFIDPARRETIEEVLDLVDLKDSGSLSGLVMTGCLVARSANELSDEIPEVDAFVDFAAYPRVSAIVDQVAGGTLTERIHGEPGTRFDPAYWDASIATGPRVRFGRAPWAYVKIAEGCDRGCAFCAIPLMRGKFVSRSMDTILGEARHLAAQGVSELSLVSQDSVMWGRDTGEGDLAALISALDGIDGLERVRLMYLHPQGVNERLIEVMLSSDVVANYFDLSLQHVAPSVLKRMGRWGGRGRFEAMISRIREGDPLAGVRSTFIVGFPGETDEDFEQVKAFVEDAEADWLGVFTYSREEGTRGHDLSDQIDPEVARERTDVLAAASDNTMARRASALVGERFHVLCERFDRDEESWSGRSHREAPEVDGDITFTTEGSVSVGQMVDVEITASDGADLIGVHRG